MSKIFVLDYSNSEIKIIDNCPSEWSAEDIDNYLFGEDGLNLNPNTCHYMYGEGIEVNNLTYSKMPVKVDFYGQASQQTKDINTAIKNLMKTTGLVNLDMTKDKEGKNEDYCGYIIRACDGVESIEEVLVTHIKLQNDTLFYKAKGDLNDDDWQNLANDVVCGNLAMLYEAVYEKIENELGE